MLTDADLARAAQDTYRLPPSLPVPASGVDLRLTVMADGAAVVAFRGSITAEDWARDFMAEPILDRAHPQLGLCHAGFLTGAESIAGAVAGALDGRPATVTGHSLGGALALGPAALLLLAGKRIDAVVTFGAPRFGVAAFARVLAAVPVRQYRRGNDPVPLLPVDMPPLLHWCDARDPLIAVGAAQRYAFACHSIDGYVADVETYLRAQTA